MICPVCKSDSLQSGSRFSVHSSAKSFLVIGKFCMLCSYEEWDYVSEGFLFSLFSTKIFDKKITHEEVIKIIIEIEKRIKNKTCKIKRKTSNSIEWLEANPA